MRKVRGTTAWSMNENGAKARTSSYASIWSSVRGKLARQGQRLRIGSIRTRLLLAFVLMALLSAVGISAGSIIVGYYNGRQQVQDRLDSVAALKALSIKAWEDTLQTGLLTVLSDQHASERVSVVLALAKAGKQYIWYNEAVGVRLRVFVEQSGEFEKVCLLDVSGAVVLCSSSDQTSDDCHEQTLFQSGLVSPSTEIVFPTRAREAQTPGDTSTVSGQASDATSCALMSPATEAPIAILARPVIYEGETLGVIVGRASTQGLTQVLAGRTGLGNSGKAYLLSPSLALLHVGADASVTDLNAASLQHLPGIRAALEDRSDNTGIYQDYLGQRVLGTYHWLPDLQMVLAVEQSLSEAFSGIVQGLLVNLGITLVAAASAVGVSFLVTRSITQPLVSLVETTAQIADGDLDRTAPVLRGDEIGMLATAFNSMTAQLRDLIGHLEQRVQKRTRALSKANEVLQRQAVQMKTSAEVSRQITSILEIDELLAHVVQLIRDAFGYSHARIFLCDGKELVLRASTSETGTGVARIPLDLVSLNTEAVRTNQAVVVNVVDRDPRFLMEELLPDTRSELATPLRIGDRVIGTLDVLSEDSNAFTEEDVLVIQSLGHQIAVAIENARLYAQSRELAVLEERNRLARDLHDSVMQSLYSLSLLSEGWRRLLRSGEATNAEEYFDRAATIAQQSMREMRLMLYELRPTALGPDGLLGIFRHRLDAVERRAGVKAKLIPGGLIDLPALVQECLQLVPKTMGARSRCRFGVAKGCRCGALGDALYRIGLEALNNALKHSGATEITLRCYTQDDQVGLQVMDNGCGFTPDFSGCQGGMGLNNMRQRAEEMGGVLTIESAPGKGTIVTAEIGCAALTATEVKSQ